MCQAPKCLHDVVAEDLLWNSFEVLPIVTEDWRLTNAFLGERETLQMEEKLSQQVDIVSYREKMNGFLKRRIDKEAVYV